jgi:hypothetical protein
VPQRRPFPAAAGSAPCRTGRPGARQSPGNGSPRRKINSTLSRWDGVSVATAARSACAVSAWLTSAQVSRYSPPVSVASYLALLFGPVHDFAEGWLAGDSLPSLGEATAILPAAAWTMLHQPVAA